MSLPAPHDPSGEHHRHPAPNGYGGHGTAPPSALEPGRVRDPVCGMSVDPAAGKPQTERDGATYHFCGERCKAKFIAEPGRYIEPRDATPVLPAPPGTVYTCPMHPEIRQDGPGACPLCGMALEPALPAAGDTPNPELQDMTRRLWIGAALAIPLLILDMGREVAGVGLLPPALSVWVQLALATPVVLWAGWPFLVRGWASMRRRSPNMFTLIALGVAAAYLDSLAATFLPGAFPALLRGADGMVPVYYEAASVIVVLVLVGQVLELRARDKTGGALRALLDLAPATARRVRGGDHDEEVPLDAVRVGDLLRVRPGDRVPVDGTVVEGASAVDEAMVTGEAMPVDKTVGDLLIGGTINGSGAVVMRAEKVGGDTLLARIVALVAEAQRSRPPIQRLADEVARWFVPAVVLVAVMAFGAWLAWGPSPAFPYALVAAVSVLIIACPCALGLATPMSIMVGIGRGAGEGILIRNAEALERLQAIDTLVVDKTGTLTLGMPELVEIAPALGFAEADILTAAAAIEQASAHPLAGAVVAAAQARGLELPAVRDVAAIVGKGVTGISGDRRIAVGSERLVDPAGLAPALAERAEALRAQGATAIFVAIDGTVAGLLALADPVKPTTLDALDRLRADGIRVIMVTGDARATADAVARRLGVTEIEAETSPEGKHEIVARLKAAGRKVAVAGDGINDAPALAAADVGIAMGAGADVAIESAGITLVKGDLAGVARARALSRATMRNIRQNLWLAFVYNGIGVPVAAGVLYPALGILLSPMVAAVAMSLSSVSVVGNALRLRKTPI
jgi:Cu+-exporting ATPase